MDYLLHVVTLENKIQRHRKRGYWSKLAHGGYFRLAYLQVQYLRATGNMYDQADFLLPPEFEMPELPDNHLIQQAAMPQYAMDQLRTSEMLANSHEFRHVELADLPKTYLVEVCHDLKRAIYLTTDSERLTFLLERLQYELLSRK